VLVLLWDKSEEQIGGKMSDIIFLGILATITILGIFYTIYIGIKKKEKEY
jgi:flagellar basal body-associated protein FliL